MTDEVFDIVCTGKGTHKRTRITKITFFDIGAAEWRAGGSFQVPDNPGTTPVVHADDLGAFLARRLDGRPNEVYVFDCYRCRRTTELRPEKFQILIPLLRERGVSRLDISDLPF
jgi:hypothetical protein